MKRWGLTGAWHRPAIFALVLLALIGCDGTPEQPLAAPFADPVVKAKLVAALPPGWRLEDAREDQIPFEHHADGSYRGHSGEMLTLTGPTTVTIEGYYCGSAWCVTPIQAQEAIELWVLPRSYPDGSNGLALQALRVPAEIYRDGSIRIYGLVSRRYGTGSEFDRAFTASSRETSPLGSSKGDLPISWADWKGDLARAVKAR